MSISRLMTASTQPPKKPATMPIVVPIATESMRGEEGDQQRDPGAVDDPAEDVAAVDAAPRPSGGPSPCRRSWPIGSSVPPAVSMRSWLNCVGGSPRSLTIRGAKTATRTRKTRKAAPAMAILSRLRRRQAIWPSERPSILSPPASALVGGDLGRADFQRGAHALLTPRDNISRPATRQSAKTQRRPPAFPSQGSAPPCCAIVTQTPPIATWLFRRTRESAGNTPVRPGHGRPWPGRHAPPRRARRSVRRSPRSPAEARRSRPRRPAQRATAGDRAADRPGVGDEPGAHLAAERPERVGEHLDPRQPAPHGVGDGLVPHGRAEDPADHVGGSGQSQEHRGDPDARGKPDQPDRGAVGERRRARWPGRGGARVRSSPRSPSPRRCRRSRRCRAAPAALAARRSSSANAGNSTTGIAISIAAMSTR